MRSTAVCQLCNSSTSSTSSCSAPSTSGRNAPLGTDRATLIAPLQHSRTGRRHARLARRNLVAQAAATMRVSDMSQQMRSMRAQMEQDEQVRILMAGLRGSNQSEADFADQDVVMRLVEVSDNDVLDKLPLEYDAERIADFWGRRPVSVITRIAQLLGIAGGFLSSLAIDALNDNLQKTEVKRAIELRNIVTSLGPAYIKLGQALSIRPDILSPAAMNELQKLCDKVPSFDDGVAMRMVEEELGAPWQDIYAELTPRPIAAASLGQVYKGRLKTGEEVAVKVQRPYVVETVSIDLFIIRQLGLFLRRFPRLMARFDVVALLDEWAARFFEELDYVREGNNATLFAETMQEDLPQVVVPKTYKELTSRRVLTCEWIAGEKLSQSTADDVGTLVNVGVISYLKQLLDTGFFHADPHPGNLIRTPDGRLAILDFGLMCRVDDNIKYGMIEAISHLVHRDYEAIVEDFVTLGFIPPGTDLRPILPVLAKVFDQALEGGGAKNINFQELAADLAQITFDYPFRIPPYFALIIRAIGVLEGIALVGNSDFAIIDEAYPYVSKRLLTDDSPRLRAALRYMVYGKEAVFDADRIIDLLGAFETFTVAAGSARGNMDAPLPSLPSLPAPAPAPSPTTTAPARPYSMPNGTVEEPWTPGPFALPNPFGLPAPALASVLPFAALLPTPFQALLQSNALLAAPAAPSLQMTGRDAASAREALRFMFSPNGLFFREFLMDEVVNSIDALSRGQLAALVAALGLRGARLPVFLPGAQRSFLPLEPVVTEDDRKVVANIAKITDFLVGGNAAGLMAGRGSLGELLPLVPTLATEVLPELSQRLLSRITARAIRELYLPG